jgi:hypothetical protein
MQGKSLMRNKSASNKTVPQRMVDFQNQVGNLYANVIYQESFVIYRRLLHQVKELIPFFSLWQVVQ